MKYWKNFWDKIAPEHRFLVAVIIILGVALEIAVITDFIMMFR